MLAETADKINTHSMTYWPQDSDETEALTPNLFLRGTVSGADVRVDDGHTDPSEALQNLYKRSQLLADRMWER